MSAAGVDGRPLQGLQRASNLASADRVVWPDMWIVTYCRAEPGSLDWQALKWVQPAMLDGEDILEADQPIVAALMQRA